MRNLVIFTVVLLFIINTQALCPSYIRLVNAFVPNTPKLDLLVNGQTIISGVGFRNVTRYFPVRPGNFEIIVRQTGSTSNVAIRTITGAPNSAYTVAVTGPFTGPSGELLYNQTPFIFVENIFPPNQNTYKGVFHRLEESTVNRNFLVVTDTTASGINNVAIKTVAYYAEQIPGFSSFTVLTLGLSIVNSSAGVPQQLNVTVNAGTIYDLFVIGDDTTIVNPTTLSGFSYLPTLEPVSGCILVDGSSIYPDSTPFTPFYSFQPCPPINSGSTLAIGLSFLFAFIAILF